ncbi:MAG: disulfide oxidoreductase [Rhodospirillaceae bacterium]|nr:MAG: disulfide oxidoreductase [Rhodospirillaceae bacterium]
MLGHATGMIGFPLRLLARENYDRVVRAKGAGAVALITGEEKIIPAAPRYYICTVESMPVDRDVAFLAVDEIQLAADVDRGHVFTDRLLHARGRIETMFLGAETIRPLIRKLVPGVQFVTRPRFSKLVYTGPKKLTRLPRRSAVVAFSVSEVYGIAELIRRHRGGAAVVMGALSPRTRNAQVSLYQNGDVDYMVATDAIGMGLNMDVDHVAFASTSKFDGHAPRALVATEMAQIAGRAGRHMNDGTFGVTADVPGIDPDIIARVESHEFPPLNALFWRNTDLRFTSVDALRSSLRIMPPMRGLTRPPPSEDQLILDAMLKDTAVYERARDPARIRMLWEVAQVPDFRKLKAEQHARLMIQVYTHLTENDEVLPEDWVAAQVARIDRTDGDIHALMDRIAATRVWTYISHRNAWLADALGWQERTRQIEDRLSDALHEKLTQQFVDRRTAHLVKRLRGDDVLDAAIADDGLVEVDGHRLGHLEGLRFRPDRTGLRTADRAVVNAAAAALRPVLALRTAAIVAAGDDAFSLDDQARLVWRNEAIAVLEPGSERLKPSIQILCDERLESTDRIRIETRLRVWLVAHIGAVLRPLVTATDVPTTAAVTASVRGIVFQLAENTGAVPRAAVEPQLMALSTPERETLARLGIRFGVDYVFMPALMKAAPIRLRGQLWIAAHRASADLTPALPPPGRVTFPAAPGTPESFMTGCGYRAIAGTAYRLDMLERFAAVARRLAREKVKVLPPVHLSLLGVSAEGAVPVLQALGFKAKVDETGLAFTPRRDRMAQRTRKGFAPPPVVTVRDDSPFAKLRALIPS